VAALDPKTNTDIHELEKKIEALHFKNAKHVFIHGVTALL